MSCSRTRCIATSQMVSLFNSPITRWYLFLFVFRFKPNAIVLRGGPPTWPGEKEIGFRKNAVRRKPTDKAFGNDPARRRHTRTTRYRCVVRLIIVIFHEKVAAAPRAYHTRCTRRELRYYIKHIRTSCADTQDGRKRSRRVQRRRGYEQNGARGYLHLGRPRRRVIVS